MFNYIEKEADGSFIVKRASYRSPRFVCDVPGDIDRKLYPYLKVEQVIKTNEVTGGKYKEYEVSIPDGVEERLKKEEEERKIKDARYRLKKHRISVLDATDKIVTVPDYPVTPEDKKKWVEYRSYVRLINETLNDEEILDYKLLTFEEWNK